MKTIPEELKVSCDKLLKMIYRAFPGGGAPDILSDIEDFAETCFEAGRQSILKTLEVKKEKNAEPESHIEPEEPKTLAPLKAAENDGYVFPGGPEVDIATDAMEQYAAGEEELAKIREKRLTEGLSDEQPVAHPYPRVTDFLNMTILNKMKAKGEKWDYKAMSDYMVRVDSLLKYFDEHVPFDEDEAIYMCKHFVSMAPVDIRYELTVLFSRYMDKYRAYNEWKSTTLTGI